MEIPDLVADHLDGEELRRGVMLGDDDVVCITPTRTLLYRSDGLLSDESVTEYPHTVERLQRKDGRRKSRFVMDYVEGSRSFSVPNDLARDVLGLVMEGVLLAENVIEDDESVTGAFRFSELTLVVSEKRAVKHIGNAVWEEEFEMFAFQDLTGLDFEKASVATEVVLRVDGRPERIKTPNDRARLVEQTVKKAVFEYFDVTSTEELNDHFRAQQAAKESASEDDAGDDSGDDARDLSLSEGGIDPLVDEGSSDDGPFSDPLTESEGTADSETESDRRSATGAGTETRSDSPPGETETGWRSNAGADAADSGRREAAPAPDRDRLTEDHITGVEEQLSELTEAVNRQNELLRDQQKAIKQLIKELRQGR